MVELKSVSLNLSPWDVFFSGGFVVRGVVVVLLTLCIVTWTVFIAKLIELHGMNKRLQISEGIIEKCPSLQEALTRLEISPGMAYGMVCAVEREKTKSKHILSDSIGLKERIMLYFERIESEEIRFMNRGIVVLATIGATAPFIGLLGTVWGIINSFVSIAANHATSLSVVAPGIAEALMATALGLVTAIPAVVVYNCLTRQIINSRASVADVTAAVMRLVSRDLSRASDGIIDRL